MLEGSMVGVVEAGLIAEEEMEFGLAGEVTESAGDPADGGGFWPIGGGFAPELGFDGPEAAHFPDGGDHFLDMSELDVVGGLQVDGVLMEKSVENFVGFFRHYDAF
jgi:hypothetical protein